MVPRQPRSQCLRGKRRRREELGRKGWKWGPGRGGGIGGPSNCQRRRCKFEKSVWTLLSVKNVVRYAPWQHRRWFLGGDHDTTPLDERRGEHLCVPVPAFPEKPRKTESFFSRKLPVTQPSEHHSTVKRHQAARSNAGPLYDRESSRASSSKLRSRVFLLHYILGRVCVCVCDPPVGERAAGAHGDWGEPSRAPSTLAARICSARSRFWAARARSSSVMAAL